MQLKKNENSSAPVVYENILKKRYFKIVYEYVYNINVFITRDNNFYKLKRIIYVTRYVKEMDKEEMENFHIYVDLKVTKCFFNSNIQTQTYSHYYFCKVAPIALI